MANEYLKRTPTSTGNRIKGTWSFWVKRSSLSSPSVQLLFYASGGSGADALRFNDDDGGDSLRSFFWNGTNNGSFINFDKLRDSSSWQHYLLVYDSSLNTNDNMSNNDQTLERLKIFVNGRRMIETGGTSGQNAGILANQLMSHWGNAGVVNYLFSETPAGGSTQGQLYTMDNFFVDGQALTPDVFGFYKDGDGYISSGHTQATDFRPGQWSPRLPKSIKYTINRSGGFGANGFYLPMNDSSNPGADFHCAPNSIITLKGEDSPQPRNGAPTTTDAYVSELRDDPFAANLVLAVPGISTSTSGNLITNGHFDTDTTGWTAQNAVISQDEGELRVDDSANAGGYSSANQVITTVIGKRYTMSFDIITTSATPSVSVYQSGWSAAAGSTFYSTFSSIGRKQISFTALSTSSTISLQTSGTSFTVYDNIVVKQEDAPRDYSADIKGSGTNKTLSPQGDVGVGYGLGGYYGSAINANAFGDYLDAGTNSDWDFGSGDFTVEFWQYNNSWGSTPGHGVWDSANNQRSWLIYHNTTGLLRYFVSIDGASNNISIQLNDVASPLNQWNHYCMERSGSNLIGYVNGVCVGSNGGLGSNSLFTPVDPLWIGRWGDGSYYVDGQVQDFRIYKGVAKYKGGFDVPKPYTPVGIESWRTTADTCKNNFATLNSLYLYGNTATSYSSNITLSDGNLTADWTSGTGSNQHVRSNIAMTSGKWYFETRMNELSGGDVGIAFENHINDSVGFGSDQLGFSYRSDGQKQNSSISSFADAFATGDIIGCAYDADAGSIQFYKNGVSQGTAFTGISVDQSAYFGVGKASSGAGMDASVNFGQNPSFSGSVTVGTNADDSGKGLFKYAPPSGFLALCEDNLPTPAIADPGKHFKCVLYAGKGTNGSDGSQSIRKVGFQPDLVWVKKRGTAGDHKLIDSVRGSGLVLESNTTDVEANENNNFTGFNSDGFDLGANNAGAWNESPHGYVAWCWKAGGAAVTNKAGSITSQVSANRTAGFSIVSYTGNYTAGATIGHGLGKKPSMMIVKERTGASGWFVYHKDLGATKFLSLHDTTAAGTETGNTACWYATEPNTTVFTVGQNGATNENNRPIIAYCWTEIEGFSKFGSYKGNQSTDGTFVYCGFKPAFIIRKSATSTVGWYLTDSSRNPTNPVTLFLDASDSDSDGTGTDVDFLSNGFKLRNADAGTNYNNQTYIFAAFAESPFQTANAK